MLHLVLSHAFVTLKKRASIFILTCSNTRDNTRPVKITLKGYKGLNNCRKETWTSPAIESEVPTLK